MRWLVSPSFPDYEISECGDVRRITANKGAVVGRVLRNWARKDGYWLITLQRSGKRRNAYIARLVLEAFVSPQPFKGAYACHRNGDRNHNHWANLRWDTPAGNQADRIAHGTDARGAKNARATLTLAKIADIKFLRSEGYLQKEIGYIVGVTRGHVSSVLTGKRWAHV